jgi:hypothetical protein
MLLANPLDKTVGKGAQLCQQSALPTAWAEAVGKAVLQLVFGHFVVRLPEDARQSDHCKFFSRLKYPKITGISYIS